MVFSSTIFALVFLPCFLLLALLLYYFDARKDNFAISNAFIFLASIIFYAFGGVYFLPILLLSAIINYAFGLFIEGQNSTKAKKILLIVGVSLNLGILCYYKYMNFLLVNGLFSFLQDFTPLFNDGIIPHIALPLGISFFTFQGISYLIDVHRAEVKATKNFITFGCYLTMFPQLVAGPIVRYASIEKELIKREINAQNFTAGAERFIMGLAKKLFIADTLGRVATAAFAIPGTELSIAAAWIGAICYTFQIYFDFSAYSDMAIGMGRMLGFTFPENFNYPYISKSIQEFWRRWHMTLSSWFRDYLYIPLGGNRQGSMRTLCNLVIVFALCGFWHGAEWNFMLWGLYHGLFLVIERLFPRFPSCLPNALQHTYTLLVAMMGWVIFAAQDASHAFDYLQALVGMHELGVGANKIWLEFFAGDVYIALIFAIIFSTPCYRSFMTKWQNVLNTGTTKAYTLEGLRLCAMLILLLLTLMPLFGSTFNAFIYFRF